MSHLIVEFNEEYNFNKITCVEGHYITDWDGNDITTYCGSKMMFAPANYNLENYYCIEDARHNELMELQKIEMEKQELLNHISEPVEENEVKNEE